MKYTQKKETGVVLATSLIMLILLTLIGIAGIKNTSLEEKMASNSRDQNLAFQAAEAALRGGEVALNSFEMSDFNGTNGLYGVASDVLDNYRPSSTWSEDSSVEFDSGISSDLINTEPRYYIKYVKDVSHDINISNNPAPPTSYFIITARGTGAQDTSQVYLRSSFAKKF